ncbi:hypothetical protein [Allorhizocola rhizosphaerae]|uniref:hypothetical protein n=1 Tax=Allorhizocola rhizosphaerae TaxID=1872709 RepID=UPI000E3DA581|nr:hypothetical protein [Allorhizocola rhizosphaerae]
MQLTYPGPLSPTPPAFRLSLPAGWEERPHATAAAFAVDSRSPAGFTVNLIVLLTRVLTDDTLDQLIDQLQAAPAAGVMQPRLEGRQRSTIDGHDAVLSALTLTAPSLPFPLFQAQAALLIGGQTQHLVHCYATCPAAVAEQYGTAFRAIFETLRFD